MASQGKKKTKKSLNDLKQEKEMDDHKIPMTELLARLQCDLSVGLTSEEARSRLIKNGPNSLTPPRETPQIVKFLETMFTGFSLLLWLGAVLCFIAFGMQFTGSAEPSRDNLYLAIVLIAVVVVTGCFSYYQIYSSSRIMESFKKLIPQHAMVVRDGKQMNLLSHELVLGDIVDIQVGDRIPADIRLFATQSLKVDQSSLTGESEPQIRGIQFTSDNPLETKNVVFFSTNVVEGTGRGIVINTGDNTVMGRIANLTSRLKYVPTTLAIEMKLFVHIIIAISFCVASIFFVIALVFGYNWTEAIGFLIGIIVANVPEGLLTTVCVMLTLTAQRMARKNCLVKSLECVETLGSCTVICSDKTGTLTQNRMTVAHMWIDENIYETDHYNVENLSTYLMNSPTWTTLGRIAMLCSRAEFVPDQDDVPILKRETIGDASESAILKWMEASVGNVSNYRQLHKKVCEIPFNSVNKYQVSIHEMEVDGVTKNVLVMKGAPEQIFEHCSNISILGSDVPIADVQRASFHEACDRLASAGERVLGFADLVLPPDTYPIGFQFDSEHVDFPLQGLTFVGLMSMIDPPRPNVPNAVFKCRTAGIKVIMVTGDHPTTGKAIAMQVGIISKGSLTVDDIAELRGIPVEQVNPREATAAVVHGSQLRDLTPGDLDSILKNHKEIVFARTSPQQKLIIVEGCQRQGNVVAVTGDGVNDAPALKKADIGIAMGITGSAVSTEAANMILLDDNFASIVTGIEEGRLIFDNLKKTIAYTVTHMVPEMVPFMMYIVLSIPLGLTTITILFIDLGTDIIPAITLAYESSESDIMLRPARSMKTDKLVTSALIGVTCCQNGVIEMAGCFFTYMVIMAQHGFRPLRLYNIRAQWDNPSVNNLSDSYGQEWTYAQRKSLEYTVYSGYFMSIVICQIFNLLACKTLKNSLFDHSVLNTRLIVALFVEISLCVLLCYLPGMKVLKFYPVHWSWWFCPVPFAVFLIVYSELRKLVARRYQEAPIVKQLQLIY